MAIDVWNEDHVQKADLIWADDMADQEKATSAAEYLIKHNVEGVVGHFSSICALNAAPIYLEKNIPLILPAATTSPGLTSLKNVFRLCAMDNQSAVLISEIALRKIKSQRILLVNDGSYYGFHHVKGIYDEIKRRANEEIEILIQKWKKKKDQNLIECMLNFNPDLVVFSGRCHVAIDFSKGTHEIFSKIPVIFGDDVIVKEYLDNVNFPLGWIWAVGPPPLTEYSGALDFIEKYKMKLVLSLAFMLLQHMHQSKYYCRLWI
ncbi:ABC transporter substrate-binding protein [Terrilactibacillus sp. S3-3]|nr:ABC transporter substrate-binding protein [Terrilactibacillus sp. S3-3]